MKIRWPEFKFPPINLWNVWPYMGKSKNDKNRKLTEDKRVKDKPVRVVICYYCGGYQNQDCPYCSGTGWIEKEEKLNS